MDDSSIRDYRKGPTKWEIKQHLKNEAMEMQERACLDLLMRPKLPEPRPLIFVMSNPWSADHWIFRPFNRPWRICTDPPTFNELPICAHFALSFVGTELVRVLWGQSSEWAYVSAREKRREWGKLSNASASEVRDWLLHSTWDTDP